MVATRPKIRGISAIFRLRMASESPFCAIHTFSIRRDKGEGKKTRPWATAPMASSHLPDMENRMSYFHCASDHLSGFARARRAHTDVRRSSHAGATLGATVLSGPPEPLAAD
jgi:hypothetical protein